MIGVLRRHDFLLVWSGGLVSVAGDWMLVVVLPYVVYAATGSTVATAGMLVAELVPGILLGSVAGVFVDRHDLRRLLVWANLGQAIAVSLLLVAPGGTSLVLVIVVAVLQSTLAAFSQPAESALLPRLVSDGGAGPRQRAQRLEQPARPAGRAAAGCGRLRRRRPATPSSSSTPSRSSPPRHS